LKYIYADGVKFKSVDGVATLEDSYLLDSSQEGVSSEEFFIHAKVTLPMFFNQGTDFVKTFMTEFLNTKNEKKPYSKHNFAYFGVTMKENPENAKNKYSIVKRPEFKYGKSKLNKTSKAGSQNTIPTIDELNQDINDAFERFESSRKDVNSAKAFVKKVNESLKNIRTIDVGFDIKSVFINM
jgi:hypothetical protein